MMRGPSHGTLPARAISPQLGYQAFRPARMEHAQNGSGQQWNQGFRFSDGGGGIACPGSPVTPTVVTFGAFPQSPGVQVQQRPSNAGYVVPPPIQYSHLSSSYPLSRQAVGASLGAPPSYAYRSGQPVKPFQQQQPPPQPVREQGDAMDVKVTKTAFQQETMPYKFFNHCQNLQNKGLLKRQQRIDMYTPQDPTKEDFDEFDIWENNNRRRSSLMSCLSEAWAPDGPDPVVSTHSEPVPLSQLHPDLITALGGVSASTSCVPMKTAPQPQMQEASFRERFCPTAMSTPGMPIRGRSISPELQTRAVLTPMHMRPQQPQQIDGMENDRRNSLPFCNEPDSPIQRTYSEQLWAAALQDARGSAALTDGELSSVVLAPPAVAKNVAIQPLSGLRMRAGSGPSIKPQLRSRGGSAPPAGLVARKLAQTRSSYTPTQMSPSQMQRRILDAQRSDVPAVPRLQALRVPSSPNLIAPRVTSSQMSRSNSAKSALPSFMFSR